MESDSFDGAALKGAFVQAAPEARSKILAEAVRPMARGLAAISAIVDLSNSDPHSFVEGLKQALLVNPGNLTAARSLIWFYIRQRQTSEAEQLYVEILQHWKDYGELHLERVRTLIVSGSIEVAAKALVESKRLFKEPGLASYRLQAHNYKDETEAGELARTIMSFGAFEFRRLLYLPDDDMYQLKTHEQQAWWKLCHLLMPAKSIALVGNANNLLGNSLGAQIDSSDVVIRCNFPNIRNFESDVGSRTDAIFFNESLRNNLARIRAPRGFGQVLSIGLHPEANFGLPTSDNFEDQPNVGTLAATARKYVADISYSRSTTGLLAINLLCFIFGKKISLFGFDFFSDVKKPHYFDSQTWTYLGHELQYEKYFVTEFLAKRFEGLVQIAAKNEGRPEGEH